jgi:hypothetical protein
LLAFLSRQGILEAITKNNGDWKAFTKFVGTRRWTRGPHAHHFSKVPMLGSMETLQVLFRSASPVKEKKKKKRAVRLKRGRQQLV